MAASNRSIGVTQTDYADRYVRCKGIPGTQDIQLAPAAIIRGRVTDAVTNTPAAKTRVLAVPDDGNGLHASASAYVTTDDHGAYRIHSLPAGTYNLWAMAPNRVTKGFKNLKTSADAVTTAPNLVLNAGGILRVRLIDDKTGQAVPLRGDECAWVYVEPSAPTIGSGYITAKDRQFDVRVIPGDVTIDSVAATSNGNFTWLMRPGDRVAAR